MFSIFSHRSFLASPSTPHAVILMPFWGTNPEPPGDPDTGRFDRYAKVGSSFLSQSALADCDVGVFPQNWESAGERAVELGELFSAACREAGKTPVVFHGADSMEPIPIEAVVFRTSLLRSGRRPGEFALPAWSEDFLANHLEGELRPRRKQARPVVGFSGNTLAGPPPRTLAGSFRRVLGMADNSTQALAGNHPRTLALRALGRDTRLDTAFALRDTFWAGAIDDSTSRLRAREEYVRNMLESDYVLCVRGIGNFSYRLYETLCMGRIPVFVDTDCVLPLEFDVDWREHCVWVDETELDQIGERILEFHESVDEAEFQERQRASRDLWERCISPQGFFAAFHRHFEGVA